MVLSRLSVALLASLLVSACFGDSYIEEAQGAVATRMRDPSSVQFQYVERCRGETALVRGEYNAKNGFGAYTGFSSFYYVAGSVVLLEDYQFSEMTDRCFKSPE
jgi:hypothetical protein